MIRDTANTTERPPMDTLEDLISIVDIVLAGFSQDPGYPRRDDRQLTGIVSGIAYSLPAETARPEENATRTRSINT